MAYIVDSRLVLAASQAEVTLNSFNVRDWASIEHDLNLGSFRLKPSDDLCGRADAYEHISGTFGKLKPSLTLEMDRSFESGITTNAEADDDTIPFTIF